VALILKCELLHVGVVKFNLIKLEEELIWSKS